MPDSLGLTSGPLRELMESWMMALDGDAHSRVRRLISRAFTPSAVESLRPDVEATTRQLVQRYTDAGGGDLMTGIAFPLPMEVVRILFGVERERWQHEVVDVFDPAAEHPDAGFFGQLRALISFFEAFVPERRAAPGNDVFSALFADLDGERLSDHELVANAVLLVTAGFETTMSMISLTILTLLRHPDQLSKLRGDPSLTRSTIDEVLRIEPAALSTTRYALTDIEVGSTTIPAGSNILFDIATANRDPDRYEEPDRFDITRSDIRPLTFGGGAHLCIGAALARLETDVVLQQLLLAAPALALADDDVAFQTANPTIRRPVRLELTTR